MTGKWNLPLTYQPKIQPVIDGNIRQTIRIVKNSEKLTFPNLHKKKVGDLIRFYVWAGKPYRSKRKTITEYTPLTEVKNIFISPNGWGVEYCDSIPWEHPITDLLAKLDGIVPPTGSALKDVIMEKNKIPNNGVKAQILRW